MKILAIETSCDDTSLALIEGGPTDQQRPKLHYHHSFDQNLLLEKWGGVVPEISARDHARKLPVLVRKAFEESRISPSELDGLAVTTHPGLLGPLLTGLGAIKTLSLLYKLPIFPVNHLYAHLEAIHLTEDVSYPYLGLLVSGGHSAFFIVKSCNDFEMLGSTIDDAAGEAFDKGAKILGLPYPGGRVIDELSKKGNPKAHVFPIGLTKEKTIHMSFSGLKTSLANKVKELQPKPESQEFYDICASYQEAITRALVKKAKIALEKLELKLPIVVGGGVACNSRLRQSFQEHFNRVHFVAPQFCTDNAAMVANYALLNHDRFIPYPQCLALDSKSRFISKEQL